MRKPTKAIFRQLLVSEINSWTARAAAGTGVMKEQAIARAEECKWLLEVFDGKTR